MEQKRKMQSLGQVYIWEGSSLWIGRITGSTDEHEHHSIQISLALEGTLALREHGQEWREYAAAMIPAHLAHALRGEDSVLATVFIEPESDAGRKLRDRFAGSGIIALPHDLAVHAASILRAAYAHHRSEEGMQRAMWELIGCLTEGVALRATVDERILRAIELIRERIHRPVTLEEIASEVYLSPSRFRHLFVQETGMAFRPYLLWLRLQRALEEYTRGARLTDAALAAGFADLAHLSRTFRRMLGINPTNLTADERLRLAPRRRREL